MADVLLVRADNPGPLTLDGTNTWIVGRDPCWVVDPGPARDAHVERVVAAVAERGGAGGIALTHDHADHREACDAVRAATGAPVGAAGWEGADVRLSDGDVFGPLGVIATPGHAPDHLAFRAGGVCCTGDAVLGAGSVFVWSQLAEYLAALERLRDLGLTALLPGHGPRVDDPAAHLGGYLAHRRERERRLLDALAAGLRSADELLDAAWSDAPANLRPAAMVTLRAHLDKLGAEGRLPEGVQRPSLPPWASG